MWLFFATAAAAVLTTVKIGTTLGACCGGGLLAALLVPVVDRVVVRRAFGGWPLFAARAVLVVGAGVGLTLAGRPSDAEAFQWTFGVPPPAGVRDLTTTARYAGGPGDVVLLIQFNADEPTIAALTAGRGFERDPTAERQPRDDRDWPAYVRSIFSNFGTTFGGAAWQDLPPVKDSRVYKWSQDRGKSPIESATLLWDPATGRAYVLHTIG